MDSVGAFAGPLIASGLMLAFGNDVRLVFWIAAVPAMIAVLPEHPSAIVAAIATQGT